MLKDAKKRCWNGFINTAKDKSLWTAHKWLKNQGENAGVARMPTLKTTTDNGQETQISSNEEKSKALYKMFFPKPQAVPVPETTYPNQVEEFTPITEEEIHRVIRNLKAGKAPGPDGIPNSIFLNNAPALVTHLLPIYRATFRLEHYPEAWKESATVVLRKLGWLDYAITKAYRPIALLNVMSKICSSCIANRLNHLVETHNLLPAHHFGGRAGRNTTDSMHLLHKFVKDTCSKSTASSKQASTESTASKPTTASLTATAKPTATESTAGKAKAGNPAEPASSQPRRPTTNLKLSEPVAHTVLKCPAQDTVTGQVALKKKKTTPEENLNWNNSWGNNLNDELQALRAVAVVEEGKKRKKRSDETLASSNALPDTEAVPPVTTRAAKTEMMDQVEGGSERGPTRQSIRPKKPVKR
ncbi:hypothetical protein RSOL_394950, partial [Rhizoctonia solani AG-3 Rhs1AP]